AQAAAATRCRVAGQEQQRASEAEARARAALLEAGSLAAEIPVLTNRLRALDEVSGLIKPRDDARRRLELGQAEQDRREAELVGARAEQAAAVARAKAVETSIEENAAVLAAIGWDAQRQERLEALREVGAGLDVRRAEWARLATGLSTAEALLAKTVAEEAGARSEQQATEARWQTAERQLGQAEEALALARDEHAAAHLRAALRKGEPCPVCDRRVERLPGAATVPMLDEMVARREGALAEERQAREAATGAGEAAVRAEQAAAHAREGVERLCREQAAVRRAVEVAEAALAAVAGDVEGAEGPTPERRLQVALTRCREQREAHQQAAGQHDRLEVESELWRQRTKNGEQALNALGEAVTAIAGRVAEAEVEWRGLADRIASVAGTDEPAAERDRLASRRTSLEQARTQAEEAQRQAALALQAAQAELGEAQRVLATVTDALGAARGALSAALGEAGFATAQAARSAARPPAEQERLAALVEQHRRDRHAVELRVAELAAELAGAEVGDGELAAAERGLLELRRRLDEGVREESALDHELAELNRRAERGAALARELAEARSRHAVYRQLADDLGSDRFQAYLLEEAFAELVCGASQRLLTLSGRYSLEFSGNAFHVLDHDNARERRSAETLSGGETFLASLALALELSQQVQRAAGAVHLDSLFIDEGFGTLDPETMEAVAEAIFHLPVGGRLVGIITHIPELTDRLPARLRVEKRPDGSEVRVELG
ncbi:MAG TPA: SbcC/MukB-like Walker B domain-containing protein, partial [Vicinamibacteria bacterium]|nr:SbcC/MukB-like Walker B domain-containing protein [Vicinamibacteria bacterium]